MSIRSISSKYSLQRFILLSHQFRQRHVALALVPHVARQRVRLRAARVQARVGIDRADVDLHGRLIARAD